MNKILDADWFVIPLAAIIVLIGILAAITATVFFLIFLDWFFVDLLGIVTH